MTIQDVLSRLTDARQTGDGQWESRCPGHADNRASLSIGQGDDGRLLVCCHAGCETKDVLAKIGLTLSDLMPSGNGDGRADVKPRIVATYDYRDKNGELLFQACRREPKGFFQRQPKSGGGWAWNLQGVRRILYRLPELLAADPTEPVFVVEGEKDVDRLVGLELVVTCNSGGASKWRDEYNESLRGRQVVILPDNDAPGRKHGDQVARALQGVAASVKVLALPGLAEKSDASDWLDAGGTAEELMRLADETPEWEPSEPTVDAPRAVFDFPLTDTGLAERFAAQHAKNVRYCHPWGKWLVWDGTRWAVDDAGRLQQLAKKTARSILNEAASEPDGERCKALAQFAMASESMVRRRAMLSLAQSETGIPIRPDALDTDPWLLNVTNGTLDLRTGQLRAHRRDNLITKLAPCKFNPDATAPKWEKFLADIFAGNSHVSTFVRRLLGYCLTGDVSEQILPILYGTGANGKSTLVGAYMDVLGPDYCIKAPADFVLMKRGEHPTAQADLFGKRFVACIETDEGRRLAESLVKDLTGGDRIRARRMREDHWEFKPTHKLVLATNHRPEIRGTDYAIWRRIALIPFNVAIPERDRDKRLPQKLQAEAEGILAWCVQGCLDWQRDGLAAPEDVQVATSDYRQEQDLIGTFLAECCLVESFATAKASDLLNAYREWSGDKKATQRRLSNTLIERGFERYTNNGVWYQGIGLAE